LSRACLGKSIAFHYKKLKWSDTKRRFLSNLYIKRLENRYAMSTRSGCVTTTRRRARCEKCPFFAPFDTKNHLFTKTGLGTNIGKVEKWNVFHRLTTATRSLVRKKNAFFYIAVFSDFETIVCQDRLGTHKRNEVETNLMAFLAFFFKQACAQ
jgi:hypothetical protein